MPSWTPLQGYQVARPFSFKCPIGTALSLITGTNEFWIIEGIDANAVGSEGTTVLPSLQHNGQYAWSDPQTIGIELHTYSSYRGGIMLPEQNRWAGVVDFSHSPDLTIGGMLTVWGTVLYGPDTLTN